MMDNIKDFAIALSEDVALARRFKNAPIATAMAHGLSKADATYVAETNQETLQRGLRMDGRPAAKILVSIVGPVFRAAV